jgi:glucose/arabinose dehydrogenase
VFAHGFRNPWGIAFDRESGSLWVADVGESEREEVNVVVAGGNYGWSIHEGTRCVRGAPCDAPGLVDPVYEYTHASGCSITGGTVYRGRAIAWLRGAYVFSDWCAGTVWALFRTRDGSPVARVLADSGYRVTAINEDAAGELHLLDYTDGGFYRLEP